MMHPAIHLTILRITILVVLMVLLICPGEINAQDTTINIGATFEGERVNQLRDASKLSTWPEIKEQEVPMTSIRYTTLPTRKLPAAEPELITAARINVDEKLQKLYRGYIKAGYGSYFTPLVDAYYTDGRSKKGTFGFHYQHISSSGGVTPNDEDSIPDHYSDNKFEAWYKYFWNKTTLQGNFNWERNVTHWYGFDNVNNPANELEMQTIKQRLNTFGGKLSYMTYARDTGDFNYRFDLSIRNTADFFNGNETNVDWLAHGRKLVGNELYLADIGINYNNFNFTGPNMRYDGTLVFDDGEIKERSFDNAVIRLVPQAQTIWKDLRVKVGMGLYIEARGDSPGHFYPLAEASYNLLKGLVVPYAGVRGSVEPGTYLGLYRENPFVQQFPDLRNKNNKLELYAGIGGALSRTVSYNAGINSFSWSNFAYFVNDSIFAPGNRFVVVYDDLKAIDIHGELAIYSGEKWKANIRGDYFIYTPGNEVHPWHQPSVKLTAGGQYNLKKKIIVGTDIFFMGKRWAKSNVFVQDVVPQDDGSFQHQLKEIVDFNLKIEYRYNRRLSAWVQFNNMLAMKYQRWSGYRTQQFLGLMGVTYAF